MSEGVHKRMSEWMSELRCAHVGVVRTEWSLPES